MKKVKECPMCGTETSVVDSRAHKEGIWRKRFCPSCGFKFSTMETPMEDYHEQAVIEKLAIGLIKHIKDQVRREMQEEKKGV